MQLYNETTNKQRQTDRKTVHYNRAKNAGILRDKTINWTINSINVPKFLRQRIRYCDNKTLGTSVIYSPMAPLLKS